MNTRHKRVSRGISDRIFFSVKLHNPETTAMFALGSGQALSSGFSLPGWCNPDLLISIGRRCSQPGLGGPHFRVSTSWCFVPQINATKEIQTSESSLALPDSINPVPKIHFIPPALQAGRPLPCPPIAQQLFSVPSEISLFS